MPKHVRFRTRHELALEMLQEHGAVLPHAWVTGDDEMGRNSYFREQLRGMNEQYLLDVPANTLVRDLNAAPPAYSGRGQPPRPSVKLPCKSSRNLPVRIQFRLRRTISAQATEPHLLGQVYVRFSPQVQEDLA